MLVSGQREQPCREQNVQQLHVQQLPPQRLVRSVGADSRANNAASPRPQVSTTRHRSEGRLPNGETLNSDATYHPQSAEDTFGDWRHSIESMQNREIMQSRRSEDDGRQNAQQSMMVAMSSDAETDLPLSDSLRSNVSERATFQTWLTQRVGTRAKFLCIVTFIFLDAALHEVEAIATVPEVSSQSITVMVNLVTLVVALTVSLAVEGRSALRVIGNYHYLWRWFVIAAMILVQYYLHAVGVLFELSEAWVLMLVYLNVPIALAISLCMFKRSYGRLEWLAVAMMTLGMATFVLIRFQCQGKSCREWRMVWDPNEALGISCILVSVFMQSTAWSLTERLLKAKSLGLMRVHGYRCRQHVYIMMVHFSFWQLVINFCIWCYHSASRTENILDGEGHVFWFGHWSIWQWLLVLLYVGHLWSTGMVIKRFSTVVWALVQIVARVLGYCLADLVTQRVSIKARAMQSLMIAPILILSAIIFQTGRLNLNEIKKVLDLREPEPEPGGWMESLKALVSPPLNSDGGRSRTNSYVKSVSLQTSMQMNGDSRQSTQLPSEGGSRLESRCSTQQLATENGTMRTHFNLTRTFSDRSLADLPEGSRNSSLQSSALRLPSAESGTRPRADKTLHAQSPAPCSQRSEPCSQEHRSRSRSDVNLYQTPTDSCDGMRMTSPRSIPSERPLPTGTLQTTVVVEEPEPGPTPTYTRSNTREENVERPCLPDQSVQAEQEYPPLDAEKSNRDAAVIDGVVRLSAGLGAAGSSGDNVEAGGGEWDQNLTRSSKVAQMRVQTNTGDNVDLEADTDKDVIGRRMRLLLLMAKYSAVIAYILSQALRENLSQKVCSSRIIVPQTLNVATSLCTLLLAIGTTLFSHGREGLVKACDFRKFAKTLICSLLFAFAAFLGSLSFAFGTSAAAKDAAGRVYTPVAALLSRWIMGKFYMWLEWLALIILTLSFVTFGLIDVMGGSLEATLAGLLCAVGAGTVSAVNSLLMEKIMKSESDPFVVQNVRLSLGNLIFSIGFIWVMGWIGEWESPPRNDFAIWAYRPLAVECISMGSCSADGTFLLTAPLADDSLAEMCSCGKGFFVGWGNTWLLYAALTSSVIYSWVTGLVVKQFSSVYRSIADGIMLLVVYFILTPILDHTAFPPPDLAKSFVVLIIPLSGTTFSYAASEMQAVMKAVESSQVSDLDELDQDLADFCGDDPGVPEEPDASREQEPDGSREQPGISRETSSHRYLAAI